MKRASVWSVGGLFGVFAALLGSAGCVSDAPEAVSWSEATGATEAPRTGTVALAEFEGWANPATGEFVIERVTTFDPYTQLAAVRESGDMATRELAATLEGGTQVTASPWCTGVVVADGTNGTNPPGTFELYTDPATVASALPGDAIPPVCNTGNTSLYSADGVFCATVRAMNFYNVPWADVHSQLYRFTGVPGQRAYEYPFGTGARVRDDSGALLAEHANLPEPTDEFGIWSYGALGPSGGEESVTWTFRNGTTTYFAFRGRVIGRVAENCATLDVSEDCDPLDRADNACRMYETGAACTEDADCVSFVCAGGTCAPGCRDGLWGDRCQFECPGGMNNACSGNGVCNDGRGTDPEPDGTCTCDPTYFGDDCSVQCAANETWTEALGCHPRECPAGTLDFYRDGSACVGVADVATGVDFTCAVLLDGTLWCWGKNDAGVTGQSSVFFPFTEEPVQIGTGSSWVDVEAGYQHACAIDEAQGLWCWGGNSWAQLGIGGTASVTVPAPVPGLWKSVATGYYHTCAIRADDRAFCWGSNSFGAIGDGSGIATLRYTPSPVVDPGGPSGWRSLDVGNSFSCGVRLDNSMWCWGSNGSGQMGIGSVGGTFYQPVRVVGAHAWREVSGNGSTVCGRTWSDELFCWGDNAYGALGTGNKFNASLPQPVSGSHQWADVTVNYRYTCGVDLSDDLWCWGNNATTVLGGPTPAESLTPLLIDSSGGWAHVANEYNHGCAIRDDNTLWCWGRNSYGQRGDGYPTGVRTLPVQQPGGNTWLTHDAGDGFSCGILSGGAMRCWGENSEVQFGNGTATGSLVPVAAGGSYTDWVSVSAGLHATCGIRSNGTLWCWGRNIFGRLGVGDTYYRSLPAMVGSETDWVSVTTADVHTCGLRGDGSLWCWGGNNKGQLGNGTVTDSFVPVEVLHTSDWVEVALDEEHTCARDADDLLWCWGGNTNGQLGNGTTNPALVPLPVSLVDRWTSVSVGEYFTCAVRDDGTLWCWGRNDYSQLGNGTAIASALPVQVGTGTSWETVYAGYNFACGAQTDGTLWCWGSGFYGQLGHGSRTSSSVPVRSGPSLSGWEEISVGWEHAGALASDGSLWVWGNNSYGNLGIERYGLVPSLAWLP